MISDYQQLPAVTAAFGAGVEGVAIVNIVDAGSGGQFPQGRVIRGSLNVTLGAAGTALAVKVRQGSGLGGAQVGLTQNVTIAAAATPTSIPFSVQDNSVQGAQAYTVTITGTAGTATVNDGWLEIMVPEPYGTGA